jgi:glycosyltransferase involved in cell wall biosynthesis
MKIIGLTRIRNESEIIKETLDHMATFCSEVYVYDDCSTDNTVDICNNHNVVKGIVEGSSWDQDRENAEFQNRQAVLELAKEKSDIQEDDWFIYMDADERIDFNWKVFEANHMRIDAIMMRLFDFYITEEDKDKHYSERTKIGPEYRDILFMFKCSHALGYFHRDQRECNMIPGTRIGVAGYVKHYGKSISIQQWEDTCEYYATTFPKYADKWNARRGKAIHTESDFGYPLITWDEKETKGISMQEATK